MPSILVTEILQTPDVGPQEAQRRLADHQSALSSRVAARGGEVLLLVGRGCVATLPDLAHALDAARDLLSQPPDQAARQWRLRASVHTGELLSDTPAIAQPAVSEARGLLELAGPNELILSASAHQDLSLDPRSLASLQMTPISVVKPASQGQAAYRLPLTSLARAGRGRRASSIWVIAGALALAVMAAVAAIAAALLLR